MTTVYTKPSCVQCDMTKRWLNKNEIPYNTIDITEDAEALEMILSLGFLAAPVVISDAGNWAGFQPDKLNLLLSS